MNSFTWTTILLNFLLVILFHSLQPAVDLLVHLRARIFRFCHDFRHLDGSLVYLHQVLVIKWVNQSNRDPTLIHLLNQLTDSNPVAELDLCPDKEQYLFIVVKC